MVSYILCSFTQSQKLYGLHVQMHFRQWKLVYFNCIFNGIFSQRSNYASFVKIMAWCRTDNKQSPTQVLWCHKASLSQSNFGGRIIESTIHFLLLESFQINLLRWLQLLHRKHYNSIKTKYFQHRCDVVIFHGTQASEINGSLISALTGTASWTQTTVVIKHIPPKLMNWNLEKYYDP